METQEAQDAIRKLLNEADEEVERASWLAAKNRIREAQTLWRSARHKRQRADKLLAAMKH